jgi:hypothetical protein
MRSTQSVVVAAPLGTAGEAVGAWPPSQTGSAGSAGAEPAGAVSAWLPSQTGSAGSAGAVPVGASWPPSQTGAAGSAGAVLAGAVGPPSQTGSAGSAGGLAVPVTAPAPRPAMKKPPPSAPTTMPRLKAAPKPPPKALFGTWPAALPSYEMQQPAADPWAGLRVPAAPAVPTFFQSPLAAGAAVQDAWGEVAVWVGVGCCCCTSHMPAWWGGCHMAHASHTSSIDMHAPWVRI